MSLSDPIADMLTRIRNAILVYKKEVEIPSSHIKIEIAKILKEEGYIDNFKVEEDKKQEMLRIYLKWLNKKENVINGLKRVSKPGCRIYCSNDKIPRVLDGIGIAIISTSEGILTDKKCREKGIGGEIICYIW
ncbi:MAG: 30S ribosomal protein S8 [Acidobacteriota bacterium]